MERSSANKQANKQPGEQTPPTSLSQHKGPIPTRQTTREHNPEETLKKQRYQKDLSKPPTQQAQVHRRAKTKPKREGTQRGTQNNETEASTEEQPATEGTQG